MKIAYFDCPYGAGGDMLLGALLDAGLETEAWLRELSKIALPPNSYDLVVEQVKRSSIVAKKLRVSVLENAHGQTDQKLHTSNHIHTHEHSHVHESGHVHAHEHSHAHESGHVHLHEHTHGHGQALPHIHKHSHADERGLSEISEIIKRSEFCLEAKNLALRIFNKLAEAEAAVHGINVNDIHFHEVGAIDSIVDIVGFAIAYILLGIEQSIVSPLPLGSGLVKTEHGLFPVPAPAVLQLLTVAKAPVCKQDISYECLTPTAAAILVTIASEWGTVPAMQLIDATGYGAGDRDPQGFSNVCRVIIAPRCTRTTTFSKHGA